MQKSIQRTRNLTLCYLLFVNGRKETDDIVVLYIDYSAGGAAAADSA